MDLAAFQGIMELTGQEPGRAAYAMRKLVLKLQASLSALEEMRVPVIAAIHGACLGGGIDLITACDIRLCTADTAFGIEEINIGMAADVGTLQRMPKLMAPVLCASWPTRGGGFRRRRPRAGASSMPYTPTAMR